ncbi:uncharacterized protein [Solanum lycopersicum]|uniref:uncharacterized protein n=1 Tax=Solanum lycopersicum TaxID=4081 RepID=UPI003747F96E
MAEYKACILDFKISIDMNFHELLVMEDSDLLIYQVKGEWAVKNMNIISYVQHTPRIQNELVDALAIIASMIKHPNTHYIDSLDIDLKEYPVHCSHVEAEPDGLPWYLDIKKYLESGSYPEDAKSKQKEFSMLYGS